MTIYFCTTEHLQKREATDTFSTELELVAGIRRKERREIRVGEPEAIVDYDESVELSSLIQALKNGLAVEDNLNLARPAAVSRLYGLERVNDSFEQGLESFPCTNVDLDELAIKVKIHPA